MDTSTINTFHHTDALSLLRQMPDESVNCIVTSPPYFQLRSYLHTDHPDKGMEIGQEPTIAEYVGHLVELFHEARRVLVNNGTLWLNLGDSYSAKATGRFNGGSPLLTGRDLSGHAQSSTVDKTLFGVPEKNLLGIPWRVAFALQNDGWILRSDIIWSKPNTMPESVTDRPTKSHEYVFLFAKSPRYWYDADAIKTPVKLDSIKRQGRAVSDHHKNLNGAPGQKPHSMFRPRANKQDALGKRTYAGFNERYEGQSTPMANRRSVWTISPKPFHGAHFAVFPPELVELCILAGCPKGGLVYDPFMGSGTTARVAERLGRNWIGSEINEDYIKIANEQQAIERDKRRQPFEPRQHRPETKLDDLPLFSIIT